MAHVDTVPVNPSTEDQWIYPAWSGKVDEKWVWGRGSADCKNQVSQVMEWYDIRWNYVLLTIEVTWGTT